MNKKEEMKRLAIYGTGGAGIEIYEMIVSSSLYSEWKDIVFIDDTVEAGTFENREVFPFDKFTCEYSSEDTEIVIAVGEPKNRKILLEKVKRAGYSLGTVISETALISPSAFIEEGSVVLDRTIVSSRARIGRNSFLNGTAIVGHDVVIGENCQICSFSMVAGHAKIGNNVFIGASSCVREETSVGDDAIVSMGAIVLKDIRAGYTAMGNPAREIARSTNGVFK